MLVNAKSELFDHKSVDILIKDWLVSRQTLLAEYVQLSSDTPQSDQVSSERIGKFYNHLVDYLAKGHFQIVEVLGQNKLSTQQTTEDLYARMTETTDKMIRIQDKYFDAPELPVTKEEISQVGEILIRQIEIEDCLVSQLY